MLFILTEPNIQIMSAPAQLLKQAPYLTHHYEEALDLHLSEI